MKEQAKKILIYSVVGVVAVVVFVFIASNDKVVEVKYREDKVDLSQFEYLDTSKSSFVNGAWYDATDDYLVLKLNDEYYQYCNLPDSTWLEFSKADSFGNYYNSRIKAIYDCVDENNNTKDDEDFGYIFDHTIPLAFGGTDFKTVSIEQITEELQKMPSYNNSYLSCFSNAVEEESIILIRANYERQEDGSWINGYDEYPSLELGTEIEYRVTELFTNCIE
jgi:hypothetical protein